MGLKKEELISCQNPGTTFFFNEILRASFNLTIPAVLLPVCSSEFAE